MKKKIDTGLIIAVSIAIFAILMLFFPYYKLDGIRLWSFRLNIPEYDRLATFAAGITAPLISLSAFLLLYLTYKSQKRELEETKNILSAQNQTQKIQAFETTFFNLISLHNSILNHVQVTTSQKMVDVWAGKHWYDKEEFHATQAFYKLYEVFKENYKETQSQAKEPPDVLIQLSAVKFFNAYQHKIGHYLANLYNFIKFIHDTDINNKALYIEILVAQLSQYELALLFYHGLSDYEPSPKNWFEKFHLFKNFNMGLTVDNKHIKLYDKSAFGIE